MKRGIHNRTGTAVSQNDQSKEQRTRFDFVRNLLFVCVFFFLVSVPPVNAQEKPERAIMFIIDGLHTEAPERLEMPHFSKLAGKGVLVEKTTAIMPHHPKHGAYANVHTCSIPNPILMAGTIFLEPDQRMIQHQFKRTAFVGNTYAYNSITYGYNYVIQVGGNDATAVDRAVQLLRHNSIDFMRVHLQRTGSAGHDTRSAGRDKPYRRNIWHEESPYVRTAEEADRQLGRFVAGLKEMGKWKNTLLVVTGDHGQTKIGGHPIFPEESWFTPAVFHGPGVRTNHTIDRADHIDLIPTIADLMQVSPPNNGGGSGKVIKAVKTSGQAETDTSSKLLTLNRIIKRYMKVKAEMLIKSEKHPYLNSLAMRSERDFYGLSRIMDWKNQGSLDALIEHNKKVVRKMEKQLDELIGGE